MNCFNSPQTALLPWLDPFENFQTFANLKSRPGGRRKGSIMAFYGMTNEYVKETNAANKAKKDIERQEILKEETKIADNKMGVNGVLLKRNFGEPLYFVNGTSCNLWVL